MQKSGFFIFLIASCMSPCFAGEWVQVNAGPRWSPRSGHSSVVFSDKMWVMGGINQQSPSPGDLFNDVWYSGDGIQWTQATNAAAWSPRREHSSLVYNNKIWVIGGSGANNSRK